MKKEFEIKILSIEKKVDFKVDKEFLNKNNLKDEKDFRKGIDENIKSQYQNQLNVFLYD